MAIVHFTVVCYELRSKWLLIKSVNEYDKCLQNKNISGEKHYRHASSKNQHHYVLQIFN